MTYNVFGGTLSLYTTATATATRKERFAEFKVQGFWIYRCS